MHTGTGKGRDGLPSFHMGADCNTRAANRLCKGPVSWHEGSLCAISVSNAVKASLQHAAH